MNFQVGKVIEYDGYTGKILTKKGIYNFFDTDIIEGNIELNDYVIFRGEVNNDNYHAFFVKYFTKSIDEINIITIKKLLKRNVDKWQD